jgi:hypothetical protein
MGTYRTVRRHATSEDTPASINTSLPKPEPVPAFPGPLCSAIVVIECEVAMRSVATSCCCFPVSLLLSHFSRVQVLRGSAQLHLNCSRYRRWCC